MEAALDEGTGALPGARSARARHSPGSALALAGILALAAALRAARLDSGLWFDEIVTLVEFARLAPLAIATTYTELNNHVAFSLMARLSMDVFGESAWALRLPAAVLGVASIAALWWLGRRVADARETALACLLLAVSYHHVWFSQNARGYTTLLLLVLLATGLFLEGMRRPSRGLWLAYAATLALSLYTHLTGVFAFATHALVYVCLFARERVGWPRGPAFPGAREAWPLLGFGLGALGVLLLYAPLLPQMIAAFSAQAGEQSANVKVAAWTNPLWTLVEIVRGLQLGIGSLVAALVLAALGAAGWLDTARRDPLFAALVVLPVPITLAAVLLLSFHIWPRYFFVAIGFAALLFVHGAFVVAELGVRASGGSSATARRVGTLLASLLILGSAASLTANYRTPKQDYARARDWVEAQRTSRDSVITAGLATYAYESYYAPGWEGVETAEELAEVQSRGGTTWLVTTFSAYMRTAHPDILERLASEFERVRTFPGTVGDGSIEVHRSRNRGAGRRQRTGSRIAQLPRPSPEPPPAALTKDGLGPGKE